MPKFAAVSLTYVERNGCIFKAASLAQLARARDL